MHGRANVYGKAVGGIWYRIKVRFHISPFMQWSISLACSLIDTTLDYAMGNAHMPPGLIFAFMQPVWLVVLQFQMNT